MTDQEPVLTDQEAAEAIARAAAELVPPLTERLARHGLSEIEVRQGELRVRVSRGVGSTRDPGVEVTVRQPAKGSAAETARGPVKESAPASVATTPAGSAAPTSSAGAPASGVRSLEPVTSPAVGHFIYAEGLGPGLPVSVGVELGFVEMLGVRHEVRAASDGVVRHLVAESGEPVEYGQLLVEVDRTGGA